MSILGQETLTWRRVAAGTYGAGGVFTDGSTTTSTLVGSVQPMSGDDVQLLPEGERTRRGRKIYTTTELRTASQSAQTGADQVSIDGVWFEVMHAETQRSVIAHTQVIVLAVTEADG